MEGSHAADDLLFVEKDIVYVLDSQLNMRSYRLAAVLLLYCVLSRNSFARKSAVKILTSL